MGRNSRASDWRETGVKRCAKCGETKSSDMFSVYKRRTTDQIDAQCRDCRNALGRTVRTARRPDTYRRLEWPSRLRRQYGLTVDDYNNMLTKQNGGCAICGGKDPLGKRYKHVGKERVAFCVDHCHETGKVRGLLCTACNRGLGLFKDNVKSLQSAVKYLTKSRR